MSGARLCGWLACGRFQTLLVLMILEKVFIPRPNSECQSITKKENVSAFYAFVSSIQTIVFLMEMILFARQQKGHSSSWHGLPLRRGRSSWMVRVRE